MRWDDPTASGSVAADAFQGRISPLHGHVSFKALTGVPVHQRSPADQLIPDLRIPLCIIQIEKSIADNLTFSTVRLDRIAQRCRAPIMNIALSRTETDERCCAPFRAHCIALHNFIVKGSSHIVKQ